MSVKNTRFVVAIDFGTARSGYAYAASHNPEETAYNLVWPGQVERTPKTPTILLADPDGKIVNRGYPAKWQLANLARDANGYTLIDMFKMTLHRSDEAGSGKPQAKRGDRTFDTFPLIVDYLRWMRTLATGQISRRLTAAWDEKEVRWCLSVPAIWSNEAKGIMRAAAIEAGLIDAGPADAGRLNLVLEPEAAAIYCQTQNKKSAQFEIKPGQTFMVVDAGGGTLDITTHRVTPDGELDALLEAAGGPFGSMYVDREFFKWLSCLLGTAAAEALTVSFPRERLKLLQDWEDMKCLFDGSPNWKNIIELPNTFYRHLLHHHGESLKKLSEMQGGEDYFVRVTSEDMSTIFAPVVEGLIRKVQEQFALLGQQRCDHLFFVGGFAESQLLRKRIRECFDSEFGGPCRVVVPDDPSRAILGGAVAYALNPGLIRTRRSRYSYGIGCAKPFDEVLDKGRDSHMTSNGKYCNRIHLFVRRGDSVPMDQEITTSFSPSWPTTTDATFQLYRTRKPDPRYIDESEIHPLNKVLKFKLPMGKSELERRVVITMQFGGTEVKVVGTQPTTGERVDLMFDLASSYFPEDEE